MCTFGIFVFIVTSSVSFAHLNELFVVNKFDFNDQPYKAVPEVNKCKVSGFRDKLDPQVFSLYACAKCYRHIDKKLFIEGSQFIYTFSGILIDPRTNITYEANASDTTSAIWRTFSSDKVKNLWSECCEAADRCCDVMGNTTSTQANNTCPRTWDGWDCWPDTKAGTTAWSACPDHVYFHGKPPKCARYASKKCEVDGRWYRNEFGSEWSNYTTCGQTNEIKVLLTARVSTFAISNLFLLPAIIIFFCYKQLRVIRISIHKNLFVSMLFNGVAVIIFQSVFMADSLARGGDSFVEANTAGCKVIYSITKYLRLTTYTWMFCEGFYLHKLITAAFTEQKRMLMFYIIGWGFPVVPVALWAILRKTLADEKCWTISTNNYEWVMFAPMLFALVANLVFLVNIIRVLVTKLRATHANEPSQFRRAVRATLVLIPLFGLHFFFVIYHPDRGGCTTMHIYTVITYCIDGLQGGIVAVIFCYMNNEIIYLLKRSYMRRQLVRSVASHMSSRRVTSVMSRGSVSTNADSIVNEYPGK